MLCGYRLYNGRFCDGRLARRRRLTPSDLAVLVELVTGHLRDTPLIGDCEGAWQVCFTQGWRRDADGVWRETKNAHRRRQRGYPAKYRRHPLLSEAHRHGFDLSRVPYDRREWGGRPAHEPRVYAECPFCKRVQILDLDVLGVDLEIVRLALVVDADAGRPRLGRPAVIVAGEVVGVDWGADAAGEDQIVVEPDQVQLEPLGLPRLVL